MEISLRNPPWFLSTSARTRHSTGAPTPAMSICSRGESATPFAIQVSVSSLAASAGAMFYGTVADATNWP